MKPRIKKHQSAATEGANERRLEFSGRKLGGLLTLTDDGDRLDVDLFMLDPGVEVRIHYADGRTYRPEAAE